MKRLVKPTWTVELALKFFAVWALTSWAVVWLWNGLIPALFHGERISFWQGVGLLLLTRIFAEPFRVESK